MTPNQSISECVKEIRENDINYPKRSNTLEEIANIKLNELFSLVYNKIESEPAYQMRDKGFLTMRDVFESKCDELQELLRQMNEYTWDSTTTAFDKC